MQQRFEKCWQSAANCLPATRFKTKVDTERLNTRKLHNKETKHLRGRMDKVQHNLAESDSSGREAKILKEL